MSKISLVLGSLTLFGFVAAVKAEIPYNWQFKVNRDSTYDYHRNPRVSVISPERVMLSWVNQGWLTGITKIDAQLITASGQISAHNFNLYQTSNVIGNLLAIGNGRGTVLHLWEEKQYLNGLFYQVDAGTQGGVDDISREHDLFGEEFEVACLKDGAFVVGWNGRESASHYRNIFIQKYSAQGKPLALLAAHPPTEFTNAAPKITALADGGFATCWASSGGDGAGYGVQAQIFTPNDWPVRTDLSVNTTIHGDQTHPRLAAFVKGEIMICWASQEINDPTGWDIFAQRLSPIGQKIGPEFQVNTMVTGDQEFPNVQTFANGNFVIFWLNRQDQDIRVRLFAPNALPLTDEIPLNLGDGNTQINPQLAALASGNFIFCWQSLESSLAA